MQQNPDFSALASAYAQAKNFLIFIHPQATYDAVAAALATRRALIESGRVCDVMCEEPMRVEYNHLVDIDQVRQEVGNRNLVVSFAYDENQVDKVTYNLREDIQRFELVIAPKTGSVPLDPSTIEYYRTGLSADIIFLFGYHSLDELGEVYKREKYEIDRAYSVALTQGKIPGFAKLHLQLQPESLSYSEMMYFMIRQLQIAEVKDDIASNLLAGIEYATNRFTQPNLPARTFETVANLMRRGARRDAANPAFEHLSTPIRDVGAQPAGMPSSVYPPGSIPGRPAVGVPTEMPVEPEYFDDMSVPVMPGVPTNVASGSNAIHQLQRGTAQHVSAGDFARAMTSRS